jgi:glycosyltransferase involved in cell wall biosynthesis
VHSVRSIFLSGRSRRVDLVARRALDWLAVRRAARLVANSHYTASRLRELYGREPHATIYPGVDLDLFQPNLDGPRGYAITVGRLSPEKGLDRLLELWRDLPDLPLHVVGSGPPDVERELRAHAPAGVIFRGGLSPSAVAEAYRGAAVAVFAAHGEEFGIAPLEAMASGVPVVAWREGGLIETVVDGQTGYLVDDEVTFRQRVRLLLHDRERWQTQSQLARQRAETFSWQRTAAAMEAVCAGLCKIPTL